MSNYGFWYGSYGQQRNGKTYMVGDIGSQNVTFYKSESRGYISGIQIGNQLYGNTDRATNDGSFIVPNDGKFFLEEIYSSGLGIKSLIINANDQRQFFGYGSAGGIDTYCFVCDDKIKVKLKGIRTNMPKTEDVDNNNYIVGLFFSLEDMSFNNNKKIKFGSAIPGGDRPSALNSDWKPFPEIKNNTITFERIGSSISNMSIFDESSNKIASYGNNWGGQIRQIDECSYNNIIKFTSMTFNTTEGKLNSISFKDDRDNYKIEADEIKGGDNRDQVGILSFESGNSLPCTVQEIQVVELISSNHHFTGISGYKFQIKG